MHMHPAHPTPWTMCHGYLQRRHNLGAAVISSVVNLITVISSNHLPYLHTQEGYPQGFP